MHVESSRPAQGINGGWIHVLSGETNASFFTSSMVVSPPPQIRAPADRIDQVHRRLLDALYLSPLHEKQLHGRGFSEEEIRARGYRSLPIRGRAELARTCHDGDPDTLAGIPGFWVKTGDDGSQCWTLAGSAGLLIPCKGPDGMLRGLRIRPDEPGEGGKYHWLSSSSEENPKPGGTPSGAHGHIAYPVTRAKQLGVVWISEGEIKSDLASERLGAVTISVPGVGLWYRALLDVLVLLPQGGLVVVAFDSEWRVKPLVHEALWRLVQACRALGYDVQIATWDGAHKGIDDLLVAGLQPQLIQASEIEEPAWTTKLSSVILAAAPSIQPVPATTLNALRERLAELIAVRSLWL